MIEPLFPVYEILKLNYSYTKNKLFFENCAISTNSGFIDFWTYSDDFLNSLTLEERFYYLRKSSLDKKEVERSLTGLSDPDKKIMCYKTSCLKISSVIEKYFPDYKLDLVFIDAEGRDDDVIRSIDFNKCIPKAILYESHNLGRRNEEIKAYLSSIGYTITLLEGDAVAEIKS